MKKVLMVMFLMGLAICKVPAIGAEVSISRVVKEHNFCFDDRKVIFGPNNTYTVSGGGLGSGTYSVAHGKIVYHRRIFNGEAVDVFRSVRVSINGNHLHESSARGEFDGSLC